MKVLLADDSTFILERLSEMINAYSNLEVVGSFRNGTRALEALRNLNPDLAIIDIKMPGLSGLDILTEIRKENKYMVIVILTFFTIEYYRKQAMKDGADYFFSKTDDFEKLVAVVSELASKEVNNNGTEPEGLVL